jgi:hypothetical protein
LRLALSHLRRSANGDSGPEKDARRGLEMRSVREIRKGIRKGEIMSFTLEKAEAQNAPEPFERPYCVDVDRRETGGTVRTFTLPERPAYFGQDHKTQALKAELEKLRVENQAMRSALEVIDRTLMTVRMSQS